MAESLEGQFICDVYSTLLHLSGERFTDVLEPVYDGLGNKSSLELGAEGLGASITGDLSATNIYAGNIDAAANAAAIAGVYDALDTQSITLSAGIDDSKYDVADYVYPVGTILYLKSGMDANLTIPNLIWSKIGNAGSGGITSSGSFLLEFYDEANGAGNKSPTLGNGEWVQVGEMVYLHFYWNGITTTGMTPGNSLSMRGHGFKPYAWQILGAPRYDNFNFPGDVDDVNINISPDGDILVRLSKDNGATISATVEMMEGSNMNASGWFRIQTPPSTQFASTLQDVEAWERVG